MGTRRLENVSLADIQAGGNDRKRFKQRDLETLAASMAAVGLREPIDLRPSPTGQGFEIMGGERRFRAARINGWSTIPAFIDEDADDARALYVMAAENGARVQLNVIEFAEGCQKRIDAGWTRAQCAEAYSAKLGQVNDALQFLELRPDIQGHIARGQMRQDFALALALAKLNVNNQLEAMGALNENEAPTLVWWRRTLNMLGEKQASQFMFDPDEHLTLEHTLEERKPKRTTPPADPMRDVAPFASTDPVRQLAAHADYWETQASAWDWRGRPQKAAISLALARALRHAMPADPPKPKPRPSQAQDSMLG